MARTESVSFQVHPNDEQAQIDVMQKFHWNLLNTQEIKTVDNKLERRGDSIYSVSSTEHYVKLSFTRDLETANLSDIRKLEEQYKSLPSVTYPALFPFAWWAWLIAAFIYGIGIIAWIAYFFLLYSPKKSAADALAAQTEQKRVQVMSDLTRYC